MMFQSETYYFNIQALPLILTSTLIFATGLFVFLQNKKSATHIVFFLFCLSLNCWLYGNAVMYCTRDEAVALRWYRLISFLGVSHISPLVFTFSALWLGRFRELKRFVTAAFLGAPVFYLLGLFTPWGIPYVQKYFWGFYPHYGISSQIFLLFFFGYFLAAFYVFFSAMKTEQDPVKKKQIQLITGAYLVSITGSVDYLPKIIHLNFYPFGYLAVFFWTAIVGYTIVRYRIMDIQTVIHKTIMWIVTSAVFGAPLIIFFYQMRTWLLGLNSWAFIGVASITLVLFTVYSRHVQPRIDHLFQRRKWDMNRALEKFTDELVRLRGLSDLTAHILNTVEGIIYASNVSLVLRGDDGMMEVARSKGPVPARAEQECGKPFLEWIEASDMLVFEKYLTLDPRIASVSTEASEYFRTMQAVLCVPLIVDQKLLAVLNIGEKKNMQPFNTDEITFLSDFRRSAAIALSNALHLMAMQENLRRWNEELEKKVEERTRELNNTQAQLVQAEKLATIGTLAGGIAHEINNPLTAVLTNAQILKMSANPDDLESLSLIEEGAKRCQAIIQKLMKYARKPMGPGETMSRVDVNKAIENTAAFLRYQLQQENVELRIEKKENLHAVEGNSNELEQVFMNLILNSKDAIKQAGRPGVIEIKTAEQNGSVQILVADNGSGISKENLGKIFDPFFTTKELGKGTGLGLAVTFGIIEKHKGKIEVSSESGQGTLFTVKLPKVAA